MTTWFVRALFFAIATSLVACSSGAVTLVPQRAARPTPSATATAKVSATPSPAPTSSASQSAASVQAALTSVQTYYLTLPHTNLTNDLQSLASEMVSSHAFTAAVVGPGGITATLPNGVTTMVFADRVEDFSEAAAARMRASAAQRPHANVTIGAPGPPTSHEIALLVNTADPEAFNTSLLGDFVGSFINLGFTSAAGYQAEEIDATLDNIAALSANQPLDVLMIDTHGAIASSTAGTYLAMESSTNVDPADTVTPSKYASDIAAGRVFYGLTLSLTNQTGHIAHWAFTMDFLLEHAQFNPGALVYNGSCFGINDAVSPKVEASLKAAVPNPAGRYIGWTKAVGALDESQSLAFMLDRALGEQSPPMTYFNEDVSQQTPAQRPFPLDDVQTQMGAETRTGPYGTTDGLYTISNPGNLTNLLAIPVTDPDATLEFHDLGADALSNDPLIYRMPSIASMQVVESATSGNLRITGSFPYAPGGLKITDNTGSTMVVPTNWTSTEVDATIPAGGPGSAGLVQVLQAQDPNAVGGNLAPLTVWDGALTSTETDTLSTMNGNPGTGMGTIVNQYTITFRSDVHPTAPTVDASAVPQNLYFSNVEGNSTASFTTYEGQFVSTNQMLEGDNNDQPLTVDFSLSPSAPTLTWGERPLSGSTFGTAALTGQASGTCNNGLPGAQPGITNVFCPGLGFTSEGVSLCTDDASNAVCAFDTSPGSKFGGGGADGLLIFTMNPTTYNITVSSNPANTTANHFAGTGRMAVGSVSGSISQPSYAPTSMTPAIVRPKGPKKL